MVDRMPATCDGSHNAWHSHLFRDSARVLSGLNQQLSFSQPNTRVTSMMRQTDGAPDAACCVGGGTMRGA